MRGLVQLVGVTALLLAEGTVAHAQDGGVADAADGDGAAAADEDASTEAAVGAEAARPAATDPESQRTAIARSLFEEGLALADRGRWRMAADRFRRAEAVRSSVPIRFNLAQSLARLGAVLEAIEMLHSVEDDPAAPPDVRASSAALRRRLEPRLARLTIEVHDAPEGARVVLDELELPGEAIGVALPVDPGPHTLTLLEEETELSHHEVELAEGEASIARLSAGTRAVAEGPVLEQGWFWAALGVVAASVALGAVIVLTADADDVDAGSGMLLRF